MRLLDARKHRFAAWLTSIAILGFTWRIVYAVLMRRLVVRSDGYRFHWGAIFLADGKGFLNPLSFFLGGVRVPDTGHPPGWTILLVGATKIGLRTWLEHAFFASVIGTVTIVMIGLVCKAIFGPRTGLIAAALAATYPNIFLYEREVLSETLVLLGIATMLWLAYKFIATPGRGLAVALGAVVGVSAMTKSDQLAIAVLLVAPVILFRRNIAIRRRIGWLALAAATCAAIMAPWSIYLSVHFDRPIPASGGLGVAMAAGNCAQTYKGELLGFYDFGCALILNKSGDPITQDARARTRALQFMRDHKGRVPVVMAARLGRVFSVYRPFQQLRLDYSGGTRWVAWWGLFEYWVLLPLAVAGAVIARRREIPIYPLLVYPAVVVLAVLPTIGSLRYRAPAEIPIVILSAVALDAVLGAWRKRGVRPHRPTDVGPESPTVPVGL